MLPATSAPATEREPFTMPPPHASLLPFNPLPSFRASLHFSTTQNLCVNPSIQKTPKFMCGPRHTKSIPNLCADPFTQKPPQIYVWTLPHKKHPEFMCGPRHTKTTPNLCVDPSTQKTPEIYVWTPSHKNLKYVCDRPNLSDRRAVVFLLRE